MRPHHPVRSRAVRSRVVRAAACVSLSTVVLGACNHPSGGNTVTGTTFPSAPGASSPATRPSTDTQPSNATSASNGTSNAGNPGNATVDRVVDGDTIIVEIKGERERVRLIGIDTPETHRPDTPVQCYGPEAADYAALLLPSGTAVNLERDVETRDDYGRLLAYVTRISDGMFVNLEMAKAGYAKSLRVKPNTTFADVISEAVRDAQQHHRGLWGACSGFGVPADSAG